MIKQRKQKKFKKMNKENLEQNDMFTNNEYLCKNEESYLTKVFRNFNIINSFSTEIIIS